jgi:hypothetical protein
MRSCSSVDAGERRTTKALGTLLIGTVGRYSTRTQTQVRLARLCPLAHLASRRVRPEECEPEPGPGCPPAPGCRLLLPALANLVLAHLDVTAVGGQLEIRASFARGCLSQVSSSLTKETPSCSGAAMPHSLLTEAPGVKNESPNRIDSVRSRQPIGSWMPHCSVPQARHRGTNWHLQHQPRLQWKP